MFKVLPPMRVYGQKFPLLMRAVLKISLSVAGILYDKTGTQGIQEHISFYESE
jgi:hypothetical protein